MDLPGRRGAPTVGHHEGLRPVLPDRNGVRDLRRALDPADPARAAIRSATVQRDPAGHAPDLADIARSAVARAGSRGRGPEPTPRPRPGARVPADARGRGAP